MNLLPEKKYRVPSWNFVEKNVLCEKGDEITRFDGIVTPESFDPRVFPDFNILTHFLVKTSNGDFFL